MTVTPDAPESKFCESCTTVKHFPPRIDHRLMEPFYYSEKLGWIYKCPVCDSPDPTPLDDDLNTLMNGPA